MVRREARGGGSTKLRMCENPEGNVLLAKLIKR